MYDNIFGAQSNYDHLFQNLQVDRNPILDSIDNMVNDIFDPNDVKDGKEYEKLSASEAKIEKEKQRGFLVEDDDDDIVMGEPVFYNNHGNHKNNL